MKILGFYGYSKIKTGGHRRYLELIYGLLNKGHIIYLFAPKLLGPLKTYEGNNLKHIRIKEYYSDLLPASLKLFLSLIRTKTIFNLKKINIDIILIFGITNLYSGYILSKLANCKLVFGLRSNIVMNRRKLNNKKSMVLKLKNRMVNFMLKRTARIIVQNKKEKELLNSNYKILLNKISVIKNNINVSWLKPNYENVNKSNELKRILFIGTLNERKNPMFLLRTLKKINNLVSSNNLTLNIAGEGPLKSEIDKYIKNNNLEANVKLLGFVDNIYSLIAESDLVIVPSLIDPCPNVILESIHIGTPVLGSNIDGINYLLDDKELLFDINNNEDLVSKIIKLYKNKSYYYYIKKIVINQKQRLNFDWVKLFEDELFDLINNHEKV